MKNTLISRIEDKLDSRQNVSTAKIAFWYTFSSFVTKGLAAISTPIFTRILSTEDYGSFSNFSTWLGFLTIIVSFDLHQSVMRAKYDFDGRMDEFISSILFTSNIATAFFWIVIEINSSFFALLFSMDMQYIRIMILYMMLEPAYTFLQIKHRIYRKYKFFIFCSVILAVARTGISIGLVLLMENGFEARVYGYIFPATILFVLLYADIINKSHKIKWDHVKYALLLSLPMLPSTLGSNILSTSDRVLINYFVGVEQTAFYTLAYQIAALFSVLWTAINQAWTPWMFDKLHAGDQISISSKSHLYVGFFGFAVFGMLLLAPEMLLIMGGKTYINALDALPPIIAGLFFQIVYGLYVNIELYYKKTYLISIGTALAALINIILNTIFIPIYGYVAAAYTTLVGYLCLMLFHYIVVKYILKKIEIYDNRFNWILAICILIIMEISHVVYKHSVIRWIGIIIYGIIFACILIKNKSLIRKYLLK